MSKYGFHVDWFVVGVLAGAVAFIAMVMWWLS